MAEKEEKAQEAASTQVQETSAGDSDNKDVSDIEFWRSTSRNNAKEAQSLRKRLRELETQVEGDRQNKLAEEGKFKELFEKASLQLKNYNGIDEKYKQLSEFAETIILKSVPEDYHDIVPNVSIEEKLQWIENATKKGLFKKAQTLGISGHHAMSLSPKEFDYRNLSDDNKKAFLKSLTGGVQRKL